MDKRRHPRFTRRLETKFSSGGKSLTGVSSNLSEVGLFIRTNRGFAPGTIVDIELLLPDGRKSFLKGIVKRAIKIPISMVKNGMGIELIQKDALYMDLIGSLSGKTMSRSEDTTTPEFQILSCPNCNTKNRVPSSKISMGPRCGRCGTPLSIIMPSSQKS